MGNSFISSWRQLPFALKIALTLVLAMGVRLAMAWPSQCRDADDGLSLFAEQLNNLSFTPSHSIHNSQAFNHSFHIQCPLSVSPMYRPDLRNISLCPWIYISDRDYDRYPSEIMYARCTCGKCASHSPSGLQHQCHPLYHSYSVIRRICERGVFRYMYTHERLPIACICSHRPSNLVN